MQVQPLYLNTSVSQSQLPKNATQFIVSPAFTSNDIYSGTQKKKNNTLKYGALVLGSILAIIAIVKHKQIGEIFNKFTSKPSEPKSSEDIVKKGAQDLADKIMGNQNSEQLEKGAKEAAQKAREISKKRQEFPELLAGREDRHAILAKNKRKESNEQLDLDYYKDDFRAFVTVPVERLNNLRKSTNPKIKEMFEIDRNNFLINEGIMIHGNNIPEKKQLLEHFISEAKKYDMEVVHIPAGDADPIEFSQKIPKLFTEAKERFINDKKATMFVLENMDKMLNLKDPELSAQNSWVRAAINEHTHKCGNDGVIWVSTVKDLGPLDESCYRGGRVRHTIDIDKAVELSK